MNDTMDQRPDVPPRLRTWLAEAVAAEASDLHLIVGAAPQLRLHGELVALSEPPLDAAGTAELVAALCPPEAFAQLRETKNVDLSFGVDINGTLCRFRANFFQAGGQLGACLRVIPGTIPDCEWAGFPEALAERLTSVLDGLIVVTGATGSGKTTTLAMIVNRLIQRGGCRVITVEEPVEYHFPTTPGSLVSQREVGTDVHTFADGLKYGLRQDPDAILVGEIRDRETAQMALSAAETGHLVFTTMHTRDAKGAISRYADLFPQDVQREIRYQLASSLRAVVAQRLLPDAEWGGRRHLALEVLWNTNPIASAIRNGKLESIDNAILTGREEGMFPFDESIRQLLADGVISRAVAEYNVREPSILNR